MQRLKLRRTAGMRRVGTIALVTLTSAFNSVHQTKASSLAWDASGTNPTTPTDGGGIWSTSVANWSSGSSDSIWPNDSSTAFFGHGNGQAGVVQLASAINVGVLVFNPAGSGDYALQGSSLNLTNGEILLNHSNPVFNMPLVGSNGLNVGAISAKGSLTLNTANTYTGTTTISAGLLNVNAPGALSTGNISTGTQATIQINTSQNISGGVVNNGNFNISAGDAVTAGPGSFSQIAGNLNIAGSLIFSGSIFNDNGGQVNGTVVLNGATPTFNVSSSAQGGTFQIDNTGPTASIGNISSGMTVLAQPAGSCTISVGSVQQGGTLVVTAANNSTTSVVFQEVSNGNITFSASGTPAVPLKFSGTFGTSTNSSMIFNTSATTTGGGSISGVLTVNPGVTLNMGYLNISSGGILTVNGTLNLTGFLILYSNSTIVGNVNITGADPDLEFWGPPSSLAASQIVLASNSSTATIRQDLSSQSIPATTHLIFQPSTNCTLHADDQAITNYGTFASNAAAGCTNSFNDALVNYGTFSTGPAGSNVIPGFNNQTGAIVAFNGSTNVSGNLQNRGTVNLNSSLVVSGSVQLSTGSFALSSIRGNAAGSLPLLSAGSLTLSGTTGNWASLLDLGVGDLIISSGSLSTVNDQVRQGFHSGDWLATAGISSTAAGTDSTHLTAVGLIQNNQSGSAIYGASNLFHNTSPTTAAILAGLTYYGDANLDGKVDGSDYSLIDSGWLTRATGWFNGDFNYDGIINGSDYALIDNAFNRQGAQFAIVTDTLSNAAATVPEPSALVVAGVMIFASGSTINLRWRQKART